MATLRIKFRISKVSKDVGTIYYSIIHKREVKYIPTNIKLKKEEWDSKRLMVNSTVKDYIKLQSIIDRDVRLLNRLIKDFDISGIDYDVRDIVSKFKNPDKTLCLLSYMHNLIFKMRRDQKFGTAQNYYNAYLSISMFLEGHDVLFYEVTEDFVERYNSFLVRRGLVKNSISFYMRILRSIYNKALIVNEIHQPNPFRNVYTGVDRTRKRAVDEKVIVNLLNLDVSFSKSLSIAKDVFLFSYFARGMSFVDIAFLKKNDIRDGMICYYRRKTDKLMSVKIEPCIMEIISKYINGSSVYIFPIVSSSNFEESYHQYKIGINKYNRNLKKISLMLDMGVKLTSYVARHSWATSARKHNIPISVISAGLGHSSEHTTEIYLAALDNSILDEANRVIINAIK